MTRYKMRIVIKFQPNANLTLKKKGRIKGMSAAI